MNKILRSSMILMAGAMLFVACQKDGENLIDLTAVVSDHPTSNSKVYLDGNLGYWQHGDQVMINGVASTNKYTLSVQTDGSTTAKILNVVKDENDKYTAAYPASQVSAINNGTSVTMTIPQKQTYQLQTNVYEGTADSQHVEMPMVAYSKDGSSLKFYNAASLIRLNLVNNTEKDFQIHYVTVTATTNNLSGTGTVSVAGLVANPQTLPSFLVTEEDAEKSVTLDCCDAHPLVENEKNIILYLVVAPFGSNESRDQLNVTVMAEDGDNKKYTFNVDSRASGLYIERGQIGAVKVTMTAGLGTQSEFWGQGTEACPYLIENYTDLDNLRKRVNAGDDEYNANTVYYLQTGDINVGKNSTLWGATSDENYYGIGPNISRPFKANYNGNNWTITIASAIGSNTTANTDYGIGLFGVAGENGSIKNLNVAGFLSGEGRNKAIYGGLVGQIIGGFRLENCEIRVKITIGAYESTYSGGICAWINAPGADVTIKNCYYTGTFSSGSKSGGICAYVIDASKCTFESCSTAVKTVTSPSNNFGGICGISAAPTEFISCRNNWDISGSYSYCGGILGSCSNSVTFDGCVNNGTVSGKQYIGGLAGKISGFVSIKGTTSNNKAISANMPTADNTSYVGGCLGYAGDTVTLNGTCTNSGDISSNGGTMGGIVAYAGGYVSIDGNVTNNNPIKTTGNYTDLGGIIGKAASGCEINVGCTDLSKKVINNAKVYSTSGNKGQTSNDKGSGGIVGVVVGSININNCYNYGAIEKRAHVGGIVGVISVSGESSITNCLNKGAISGTNAASQGVGGIVGGIRAASHTNGITIKNCGNEGSVTGTGGYAGGILGYCYNNNPIKEYIYNCYCNANVTGTKVGGIMVEGKYSSYDIRTTISNCYYNGVLNGSSNKASVVYNNYAVTLLNFTYCYSDATTTNADLIKKNEGIDNTYGTKYAARTFNASTGLYAGKGANVSDDTWGTGVSLLNALNAQCTQSNGYRTWTVPKGKVLPTLGL